ncbi:MAG: SBBP repeat-containing protein, partial [Gammaproteobacteria bacterium]
STPRGFSEGWIAKVNASGSALVYSTYLGGNSFEGVTDIAVDSAGNAYVCGRTESSNFPTVNAFQATVRGFADAYVAKLNAAGSALVYSTYLGGSGADQANSIAVDSSGNAYVTGNTSSNDFPRLNAVQAAYGGSTDAFITKLNAAGSALVYSTYLGGTDIDSCTGIAIDAAGNAAVGGNTVSGNFPTANAVQSRHGGGLRDAVIAKLNAAGTALVYSTYFGGTNSDVIFDLAMDAMGTVYATGNAESRDFPVSAGAFQRVYGGFGGIEGDAFLLKISDAAPLPAPSVNPGGVVGGASFAPALSAGGIASLFGGNFSSEISVAGTLPLPTTLAGATVRINNIPAPLFFVSPTQINFQIPWELQDQADASLIVTTSGGTSSPERITLGATAPGMFSTNSAGTGQGAILIAETGELAAPGGSVPGRASRPARIGEFIAIFCTGLG